MKRLRTKREQADDKSAQDLAETCHQFFATHPQMVDLRGQVSASPADWSSNLDIEACFTIFDTGATGASGLHLVFKALTAPDCGRKQRAFHAELAARGHQVVIIRTTEAFEASVLEYVYGRADAEGNRPYTVPYKDRPKVS
jgi:hypothetical protein